MDAIIVPDGSKFAVWVDGELSKDGFDSREDAAWWVNSQGYNLN